MPSYDGSHGREISAALEVMKEEREELKKYMATEGLDRGVAFAVRTYLNSVKEAVMKSALVFNKTEKLFAEWENQASARESQIQAEHQRLRDERAAFEKNKETQLEVLAKSADALKADGDRLKRENAAQATKISELEGAL